VQRTDARIEHLGQRQPGRRLRLVPLRVLTSA
jgi:hypothetical protein